MPENTDWYPTENADWYPQRLRWPGPGRLQLRLKPQLRRARAVWSFVFVSSITLLTLLYGLLKDWFEGLVGLTGHNEAYVTLKTGLCSTSQAVHFNVPQFLAQPALYRARATVGAFRPDRIPIKTGRGLRLCGFPFGIVSGVFRARPSLEMNFFCFFSDTWAQIAIGSLQLANRGALSSGRTGSSEFPKSWIVSGVFSSQKTCGGRLSDKKRQLFRRHLPKTRSNKKKLRILRLEIQPAGTMIRNLSDSTALKK